MPDLELQLIKIVEIMKEVENLNNTGTQALNIPVVIHLCKLVPYGKEEKRCIKCGYITWNSNKSDSEIIEDMIKSGYDVPNCDNGV